MASTDTPTAALRDRLAIAGVGATPQGRLDGRTPLDLGVEAFRNALDDAGLRKGDIDGLLTMPGTTSPEASLHYLRFGEAVGIDPRYTGSMTMGGGTAGALVQMAALAINAGWPAAWPASSATPPRPAARASTAPAAARCRGACGA